MPRGMLCRLLGMRLSDLIYILYPVFCAIIYRKFELNSAVSRESVHFLKIHFSVDIRKILN